MAGGDEEAIETFMSITGVSEPVAIQKLTEHAGNLNEAINAHFGEGDGNITNEASVVPQEDIMDVDDPIQYETHRTPFPLLPSPGLMNPFSLLGRDVHSSIFDRVPNLVSSIFDRVPNSASRAPFVSHPREAREIPIEVKDGNEQSSHSGYAPTIQDITGTANDIGPEIHGTVIIDEEDDEDIPVGPIARVAPGDAVNNSVLGGYPDIPNSGPSAPGVVNIPDYNNNIEEEMIRSAIEASKQDTESSYTHQSKPIPQLRQSHIEDPELAHAISLSFKEIERHLALKKASLPHEPSPDDGNAINLLVRMPDGSRQSRRFLKSHKLQHLFDFIDVGRVVRPGTYRLVRPHPRRAFSDSEGAATFDELGLSGRQEALFLELI